MTKYRSVISIIAILLLPISLICCQIGGNITVRDGVNLLEIVYFVGEAAGFILAAYWIGMTIYRSRKASKEQMMAQMAYARNLEQAHYQEIEKKRAELNLLRSEMSSQIQKIQGLLDTGNETDATEMLQQLSLFTQKTKEYPYCSVAIINAVLSEKEALCRAQGISLEIDLKVDEQQISKMEDVHLCSIFSNLLDNAIRAVGELPEKEREIHLSAAGRGALVVIKIVNPTAYDRMPKLRKGHGKGTLILKEIAKLYYGSYSYSLKKRTFTGIVNLELREG